MWVNNAIRKDLHTGGLDITVTVASEVEGDEGGEEANEDTEGDEGRDWKVEDDEGQDQEEDTGLSLEVNLPRVPIWYKNVVMKKLWKEASLLQKNMVEQYKKNEAKKTLTLMDNEMGEDDRHKVTQLEEVVLFITSHIWYSNFGTHLSHHCSHRAGVEHFVIQVLDRIFKETGLVGSVCLAGPDPQKGGKLMMMLCVPWLPFIAHTYICV